MSKFVNLRRNQVDRSCRGLVLVTIKGNSFPIDFVLFQLSKQFNALCEWIEVIIVEHQRVFNVDIDQTKQEDNRRNQFFIKDLSNR